MTHCQQRSYLALDQTLLGQRGVAEQTASPGYLISPAGMSWTLEFTGQTERLVHKVLSSAREIKTPLDRRASLHWSTGPRLESELLYEGGEIR